MGELLIPQDEEQIVKRDADFCLIEGLTPINDVMRSLEIEDFPDRGQYETIAGL